MTLNLTLDDESARVGWPEVEQVVRQWAATGRASLPPELPLPRQGQLAIPLHLQTDDLLTAIGQLHDALYDLGVNFTFSVD